MKLFSSHLKTIHFLSAFFLAGAIGLAGFFAFADSSASASVDDYSAASYGSVDSGITFAEGNGINDIAYLQGFMNGDFSYGLKFWGGLNNKAPSDFVAVSSSGENKYLEFKETATSGDGLTTLRFSAAKLLAGKPVVLVYDCNMPSQVEASLVQWDINRTQLLSSGEWKLLYEAKNENEWNTVVTKPIYPVMVPEGGYYELYFFIELRLITPLQGVKIDNIRLAYTNENEVIYDPDGNEIKGESRSEDVAEEPGVIYDPSANRNTASELQSQTNQDEQGGDNEDLIRILIIVGTAALAVVLAVGPSIVVKAVRSKKNSGKEFSEMLEQMDKDSNEYIDIDEKE